MKILTALFRLAKSDPKATLLLLLVAGAMSWLGTLQHELASARAEAQELALDAANANARADRSHPVLLSARDRARILGDSLAAVARLAEQVPVLRTALDRATAQIPRITADFQAQLDTLRARVASQAPVTRDSADVRRAQFRVRQIPFTVDVEAALPPPPAPGLAQVRVAVDPVHVQGRLGCSEAAHHGVRAASLTLITPTWLHATIDSVHQDPAVCGSLAPPPAPARCQPAAVGGIGISVAGDLHPRRSAFIGVAIACNPFR